MKLVLIIITFLCGIYAGVSASLPRFIVGGMTYEKNQAYYQKLEKVNKARAFIKKYNPQAQEHALSFVEAGESAQIDYRQLLAQAVLESSMFKADSCQLKGAFNGFGYNSNHTCFKSQREAIHFVARTLSVGDYYRGQRLQNKLCIWVMGFSVHDCGYANKAIELMKSI